MIKGISNNKAKVDSEIIRFKMNHEFFIRYKNLLDDLIRIVHDQNIIFRPHLSENIKYWKDKLIDSKNIFIKPYESIHKWIVNSIHHIHFNSTTAIESALLGIPRHMIAIPEEYKVYNLEEVNLVSYLYLDQKNYLNTLVIKRRYEQNG